VATDHAKLLDLRDLHLAQIGQRLFRQPRRDADAQSAGDELDDGEAALDVCLIE
jgi:hypothetical protein